MPRDPATIAVYEARAAQYRAERKAYRHERAEAFARAVVEGGVRLDLGCGPGLYLPHLGTPTIAADAALAMVREAVGSAPGLPGVQCDLTHLPFARGALAGVWASKAHQHIAPTDLPGALAELHRVLPVGGRLDLTVFAVESGSAEDWTSAVSDDELPGRLFTFWHPDAVADLLVGAGFDLTQVAVVGDDPARIEVTAHRARTLADSVGGGMRLLLCGLNPSVYSADAGVGFARPGNRFWPAARLAGLTDHDRDPAALLRDDDIGMTDVVKRATPRADELTTEEYRAGLARVTRLCRILEPAAICFVGLAGWRAAVDRKAQPGWQPEGLGPTPVYVMPSTSGLNARVPVAELADHLATAATGP